MLNVNTSSASRIWCFIDYENVGNLDDIDLSIYEKVILFIGSRQRRVSFGSREYSRPIDMQIVKVSGVAKNNLDFYLASYIGQLHVIADNSVVFEVLSADKGFSHLIEHYNSLGRVCQAVDPADRADPMPFEGHVIPEMIKVAQCIKGTPAKDLPRYENRLARHIESLVRFPKEKRTRLVNDCIQYLKSEKVIKVNCGRVMYTGA